MKAVFAFLCLLSFSTLQAQDFYQDDITAMLTAKFTFDGEKKASRDDSFKLGFAVDHSYLQVNRNSEMNLMGDHSVRRSLLDIEISSRTKYFSRFTVGGVDALTYRTTLNANGEPVKWPMGLSTEQMVGIGIIAGALGYYVYDSNTD